MDFVRRIRDGERIGVQEYEHNTEAEGTSPKIECLHCDKKAWYKPKTQDGRKAHFAAHHPNCKEGKAYKKSRQLDAAETRDEDAIACAENPVLVFTFGEGRGRRAPPRQPPPQAPNNADGRVSRRHNQPHQGRTSSERQRVQFRSILRRLLDDIPFQFSDGKKDYSNDADAFIDLRQAQGLEETTDGYFFGKLAIREPLHRRPDEQWTRFLVDADFYPAPRISIRDDQVDDLLMRSGLSHHDLNAGGLAFLVKGNFRHFTYEKDDEERYLFSSVACWENKAFFLRQ